MTSAAHIRAALALTALSGLASACSRQAALRSSLSSPALAEPLPATAAAAAPAWAEDAIGYEIFVRSFQDSDGDGIGDLRGLTRRLDYLAELGVDLLWLMPIHRGPSWHGYEISDYEAIEPDYGTSADWDALVKAVHARGMRIILDYVMNHTASTHPWFKDAASDPSSPKRGWYVWRDRDPGWTRPWDGGPTWHRHGDAFYYGLFTATMPDLNYQNPDVRRAMQDIARSWLARGADGFRLDAARHLIETGPGPFGQSDTPETHAFWRELRRVVDDQKPGALLVGEVWEENAIVRPYFGTRRAPELNMAFDFSAARRILSAISRADGTPAVEAIRDRLASFPSWGHAGTFLTNHDQARIATQLAGSGPGALELAAALLLTWPGTPWLYYGEEIGLENGDLSGDAGERRPMQWDTTRFAGFTTGETSWLAPASTKREATVAGQAERPRSLLSLYRKLISIRRARPMLRRGGTRRIDARGTASLPLVIAREHRSEHLLLAYSFAAGPNVVTIPPDQVPSEAETFEDLVTGRIERRSGRNAALVLTLEPRGFRVLLPVEGRSADYAGLRRSRSTHEQSIHQGRGRVARRRR